MNKKGVATEGLNSSKQDARNHMANFCENEWAEKDNESGCRWYSLAIRMVTRRVSEDRDRCLANAPGYYASTYTHAVYHYPAGTSVRMDW